MSITNVRADTPRELQDVADVLADAKKVVVFTGAGISTNCGIPVSSFPRISMFEANTFRFRISAPRMVFTLSSGPNTRQRSPHLLVQKQQAVSAGKICSIPPYGRTSLERRYFTCSWPR